MAISVSKLNKKFLGDWVVNPYVGCQHGCRHCYVPVMPGNKFKNGGRSQRQWGEYLIPKPNFLEDLARDLGSFPRPGSAAGGGRILASFLTDPYTPAEAELKLTRRALEMILGAGCAVRVQTRSALAERDFDLFSSHPGQVLLGASLPYLDGALARVLEPRATAPVRRLEMLRRAKAAGVPVYIAIAPFLPWHGEAELREVVDAIRGLDPVEVFDEVLNPRGENAAMMNDALAAAGRSERVPADYRERWPRITLDHLRMAEAICKEAGLGGRFKAWPDPVAAKARTLPAADRAWLQAWIPKADQLVLVSKRKGLR